MLGDNKKSGFLKFFEHWYINCFSYKVNCYWKEEQS